MSRHAFLGYARGAVAGRYRALRLWGAVLMGLGLLVAAIPLPAGAGQEEALVLGATAVVTAVAPGAVLFVLSTRKVEQHPPIVAMGRGQQPTSFSFRWTLRGHVCEAAVIVEGIPYHFAIPRELMPE